MSDDAREKAIEQLANLLPIIANRVLTRGYDLREYASGIIDALGLVAVSPELVDRIRKASGCYVNCAGPQRGYVGDMDVVCDQCAEKMELADHILAQLTETKGTT
jgi:hypothetical protein